MDLNGAATKGSGVWCATSYGGKATGACGAELGGWASGVGYLDTAVAKLSVG